MHCDSVIELPDRYASQIHIDPEDPLDNCWIWKGKPHISPIGTEYPPTVSINNEKISLTHLIWELINKQKWPIGLEACHECLNTLCVLHVYPGTHSENMSTMLEDTCRRGHLRSDENIYIHPSGYIRCRICRRELDQRRRQQNDIRQY